MTDPNPYSVYADETILNASPMGLIVALYEGAIDSCSTARMHMLAGDIPARTKSINKLTNIVNELTRCLNDEKGGEISANLRRLYAYIQGKVIEAHTRKKASALEEVEKLLTTMLEGWRGANVSFDPSRAIHAALNERTTQAPEPVTTYDGYLTEPGESYTASAYLF